MKSLPEIPHYQALMQFVEELTVEGVELRDQAIALVADSEEHLVEVRIHAA